MSLVVRLRSVVCLLGRFPALAGADLDVATGEIVLVTGPNGAGKTTLFGSSPGLVPPYSGEAEVRGRDLFSDRSARPRRRTALVGHETYCYDDLTAAREPALLRPSGRASGRRADVEVVLERVALGPAADVVHRELVGRAAAPSRARGRAGPRTRTSCCSTSRTPDWTPPAAQCSPTWCATQPAKVARS